MKTTALLLLAVTLSAQAPKRTVTDAEVKKVHKSALFIDTHNDITSRTVRSSLPSTSRATAALTVPWR